MAGTGDSTTILGNSYSPEYIIAIILRKPKKDAELYLGAEVGEAVISVTTWEEAPAKARSLISARRMFKSVCSDMHLGGRDFDQPIANHVTAAFLRQKGIDTNKDRQTVQRVRQAAELARIGRDRGHQLHLCVGDR